MCDGILCEKLEILLELVRIEKPEEYQAYMQAHLAWSVDELKTYRNKLVSPQ